MLRTVNFCRIDWLRKLHGKKGNHFEVHLSEVEPGSRDYHRLGREDAELEEVENEIDREEHKRYMEYALPMLTEAQRKALILNAYFELKIIEIGQILGKNPNTVSAHIWQARRKLKDILTTKKEANPF